MDSQYELLLKYVKGRFLVAIHRQPQTLSPLEGFILDFSESLILLQRFLWEPFALNGYAILPLRDAASFEIFDEESHWVVQAISKAKMRPQKISGLVLENWQTAIASTAKKFPLIDFQAERQDPDNPHLGKLVQVDSTKLIFHKLDFEGTWVENENPALRHLTQISFGGGYESAFAENMPPAPANEPLPAVAKKSKRKAPAKMASSPTAKQED
jgi:hypothetical protein